MLSVHLFSFSVFSFHSWICLVSIINIALCYRIVHKTNIFNKEEVDSREKLNGLERYMKEFATIKEKGLPEVSVWDYYMIFALAFGIAPHVLKNVRASYPNIEDSSFANTSEICEFILKCNFEKQFITPKQIR